MTWVIRMTNGFVRDIGVHKVGKESMKDTMLNNDLNYACRFPTEEEANLYIQQFGFLPKSYEVMTLNEAIAMRIIES